MNEIGFGITLYLNDLFSRRIGQAENHVRGLGNASQEMANNINTSMLRATSGVFTLLAAYKAFNSVKAVTDLAGDFQQTQVSIRTMVGDVVKGNKLLGELKEFALSTPYNFKDLTELSKLLLAYNVPYEETINGQKKSTLMETMNILGEIGAGVGKDKLKRLGLAYGQMRAKGRLMGEELRQFSEAGVPVLPKLAEWWNNKKYGGQLNFDQAIAVTTKDMENKTLIATAQQVHGILQDLTGETGKFGGLMKALAETYTGKLERLKESWMFFKIELGNEFLPTGKELVQNLGTALDRLNKMGIHKNIAQMATVFIKITAILGVILILTATWRLGLIATTYLFSRQIRNAALANIATNNFIGATGILGRSLIRTFLGFVGLLGVIATRLVLFGVINRIVSAVFGLDNAIKTIALSFIALFTTLGSFDSVSEMIEVSPKLYKMLEDNQAVGLYRVLFSIGTFLLDIAKTALNTILIIAGVLTGTSLPLTKIDMVSKGWIGTLAKIIGMGVGMYYVLRTMYRVGLRVRRVYNRVSDAIGYARTQFGVLRRHGVSFRRALSMTMGRLFNALWQPFTRTIPAISRTFGYMLRRMRIQMQDIRQRWRSSGGRVRGIIMIIVFAVIALALSATFLQESFSRAIRKMNQTIERSPFNPKNWFNRGYTHEGMIKDKLSDAGLADDEGKAIHKGFEPFLSFGEFHRERYGSFDLSNTATRDSINTYYDREFPNVPEHLKHPESDKSYNEMSVHLDSVLVGGYIQDSMRTESFNLINTGN